MKTWHKMVACVVAVTALVLVFMNIRQPNGAVGSRSIVSYCIGDAANDGVSVLVAISGSGKIAAGERHGQLLLVCDESAKNDMDKLGYIPPEKILYNIDLSELKPVKVQLGDVNGDGLNEIAICVYKTAKFHPVDAKRPFFFDLVEGNLIPVWLGSRLSRPFDDYVLYDIDDDAVDEIISIEQLENGNRAVAVYNWRGFGFEMSAQSEEFAGQLSFVTALQKESLMVLHLDRGEYVKFEFFQNNGELEYKITDN